MVLRCDGLHIDEVQNCSSRFCFLDSRDWFHLVNGGPSASAAAWREQGWHEQFQFLRNTLSDDDLGELFWWISNPANAERLPAFEDLIQFHDDLQRTRQEDSLSLWNRCNDWLSTAMGMYLFMIGFGGRCIFQTTSGRLGVTDSEIRQGEHIVFLPEGDSLFVLSANERLYRGVAYVNGLMGGALLDPPNDLKLEWKSVQLV